MVLVFVSKFGVDRRSNEMKSLFLIDFESGLRRECEEKFDRYYIGKKGSYLDGRFPSGPI